MILKHFSRLILLLVIFSCGSAQEEQPKSEFDLMVEEGKFEEAYNYYSGQPEGSFRSEALLILGKYYNEQARYDISRPIFEKIIEQDSVNPVATLFLANIMREIGDYNGALPLYNQIADIDSMRLLVWPERARLYVLIGDEQRALVDIEKAKEISDKYFAIFIAEGLLYNSQGKTALALEQFEQAERLDPGVSSEASLYAGILLMKLGVNLDAIDKFTNAIEVAKNINMGYAFINRGICQMALLDTNFACNDFESAKAFMPEQAEQYQSDYCP